MEVLRPVVWRRSGVRVVKVTSFRAMAVVFEPRELEAVHSAPVSSSSGVTRTLRVLTAVCGSGFHSVA